MVKNTHIASGSIKIHEVVSNLCNLFASLQTILPIQRIPKSVKHLKTATGAERKPSWGGDALVALCPSDGKVADSPGSPAW